MGEKLQAPKGTVDFLPPEARRRLTLFLGSAQLLTERGYEPIETPTFEATELFARGVGESTDIVQKEMFSFEDAGGRLISLRPEGTAGVCRAYIQHGMHKLPQPVKLWYWGPFFRYEAPQAGRHRQFTQVGAEVVGSPEPTVDAEVILLLRDLLARHQVEKLRLRISSLGTAETRREYRGELTAYLNEHASELPRHIRERSELNPLRAFDADDAQTQAVVAEAPRLIDRLTPEDRDHFEELCRLLSDAGVQYEIDGTLVRGLDYYTRTVFEFTSDALGAQSGVAGGGRYDGLIEQLGGRRTPAIGWAAGVERIVLASAAARTETDEPEYSRPDVFVALDRGGPSYREGFLLLPRLHKEGFTAQMEQAGRSLKGQLRHADRIRADFVVQVGPREFVVIDTKTRHEWPAATASEVLEQLHRLRNERAHASTDAT